MLISTKDLGKTWSAPVAVAHPGTRVLWPWIAAGDAGKVSVVWYQTEQQDGMPDLDCQTGHIHVTEASIAGATAKAPKVAAVDAAGRVVHIGWVCQGGTTCVATGQDRRLGDYFTNALDARGCVLIATGDTRLTRSDDRRAAAHGTPALHPPERRPKADRLGHLFVADSRDEGRLTAPPLVSLGA